MKYPCNLIKDILPLYHDQICSDETNKIVETHLDECTGCKEYYDQMCASDYLEDVIYDKSKSEQVAESYKKVKKKTAKKIALIVLAAVLGAIVIYSLIISLTLGFLTFDVATSKIEVHDNVKEYQMYRTGEQAKEEYRDKWGMDESIWPKKITTDMDVQDYKMVYYNPWDAQYLGYMAVKYDDTAYESERKRLEDHHSTEYLGYYGVKGFENYELLAMYADDYYGFVYALTDGKNEIIYVEMIFCNYFMDLDYTKYIPQKYLPTGFDATKDNPYRSEYLEKLSEKQN